MIAVSSRVGLASLFFLTLAFVVACASKKTASSGAECPVPEAPPADEASYVEPALSTTETALYDPDVDPGREISDGEVEVVSNSALAAALAPLTVNGAQASLSWDPERFSASAVLRTFADFPESSVEVSAAGGSYVVFDTGPRRIIVSAAGGLPPESLGPDDVVVSAMTATLGALRIEQRFERTGETARLAQVVAQTKDGDPIGLANVTPTATGPRDCIAEAWARAKNVPPMTVVHPEIRGCDIERCVEVRRAWISAQHDLMRAYQMMEFIGEAPPEQRAFFWKQPGWSIDYRGEKKEYPHTAPERWFGAYAPYRFAAIRQVIRKLYLSFQRGEHYSSGLKLALICPKYEDNPGNICFIKRQPPAHHGVPGFVNFCDKYFGLDDVWHRLLMSHEVLHHTFVSWKDTVARYDPVQDIHYHAHSVTCAASPITGAQYGLERIDHLATYENANGSDCNHKDIAFRNNDTYGYFTANLGVSLTTDGMKAWPSHWPPKDPSGTNNPPEACSNAGLNPPPPGVDWQDPAAGCQKIGLELVCPSSGGGGSFGGIPKQLQDLQIVCPP